MRQLTRVKIATVAAVVAVVAAVSVAIAHEPPERRPVLGVLGFGVALGALMFTTEDH